MVHKKKTKREPKELANERKEEELSETIGEVELKKVEDKKPLPPGVEHKVLTDEEKKRLKREAHDKAKSKLNMEVR